MESKRQIKAHWGLLLVAYWALLIPTALVAVTSQANVVPFLVLLVAGIPIYFIAANTIVNRCESQASDAMDEPHGQGAGVNVIRFPGRGPQVTPRDVARATAHAHPPHLRRVG